MRRLIAVMAGVLLMAAEAPAQKIYKWTDADGRVQYTQTPPPEGVKVEQSQVATVQVTEERRRYCAAIRNLAHGLASRRHSTPIDVASNQMRSVEISEGIDVDQIALRELVNFVYSGVGSGRASRADWEEGTAIAARAQDACLNGSFGKHGRSTQVASAKPSAASARESEPASVFTGTGWITHGMIATNYHVIEGKDRIRVRFADGREATAFIGATDERNDVALLRVPGQLPPGLPLASGEAAIGAEVFTLGYPHTAIMGSNAKLSTGIVNATTGVRDDPRLYQISVPVQSGNSGGPLLNRNGEVVGLVTAKLSAAQVYQWTGDLPQNVNYAVKVDFLAALLQRGGGEGENLASGNDTLETHAARIGPSVVQVIAE